MTERRMNLLMQVVAIIGMITMSSCAAMSQKNKHVAAEYYEDLSDVRPSFKSNTSQSTTPAIVKPAEADIKLYKDDSKALNSKLDTIAAVNQRVQTAQGYRILVYAGLSSDESQKMRQLVYSYNSDLNVYTQYRQPSFRVKVGDFQDRVEASYILNDLKKSFPSAMIVPDQINLVR